jgi:hypothetical protein
MRGWAVCRFHGAKGGAPSGKANGRYTHGLHTREAKAERSAVRGLINGSRLTESD